MTSCCAAYIIAIWRSVVMPLFMWRGLLSRDFRGVPVAMLTFSELCAMG